MSDRCEDRICYLAASAQTCAQNRSTARQCQQALKPHLAHFWLGPKDPCVFPFFLVLSLFFLCLLFLF